MKNDNASLSFLERRDNATALRDGTITRLPAEQMMAALGAIEDGKHWASAPDFHPVYTTDSRTVGRDGYWAQQQAGDRR